MSQGQIITTTLHRFDNGTSTHPGSPWLQVSGLSLPSVLPCGPDPTEGIITMHRVCIPYSKFNQEMLKRYIFKLAQIKLFLIFLCVSALHKNMKFHYLHKTTSHISPGPLPIITEPSTWFLCLWNQYLFLLPKFFHLTLSLTDKSLFTCTTIIIIVLNVCISFRHNR